MINDEIVTPFLAFLFCDKCVSWSRVYFSSFVVNPADCNTLQIVFKHGVLLIVIRSSA